MQGQVQEEGDKPGRTPDMEKIQLGCLEHEKENNFSSAREISTMGFH
jgi:hypothetical protein